MSSRVMDLHKYSVVFTGVDDGKCWVNRYSNVSTPGFVMLPSVFSTLPSVCLVELSIIFLKVLAASTELIFSLYSAHEIFFALSQCFLYSLCFYVHH